MVDLLLSTDLDEDQRQCAAIARESATGLLSIINDILDFSKMEAGKLGIETSSVDLAEIAHQVLSGFGQIAAEKGLTIVAATPCAGAHYVADPVRLRQILTNLVANATKFTSQGRVVVRILPQSGGVRIEVADTGVGIPPERHEAIFASFTQADGSTTRKYGGTGLGLAIVRRLVTLMGGSVTLESAVGEGATFRVDLPLEAAPYSHSACRSLDGSVASVELRDPEARALAIACAAYLGIAVAESGVGLRILDALAGEPPGVVVENVATGFCASAGPVTSPKSLRGALLKAAGIRAEDLEIVTDEEPQEARRERVLLVEDNAVNRRVALRQLERLGVAADVAENGLEALEMMASARYDLVFMDVQMPVLDGLEATREIRRREAEGGERTRIVAMTAHAMQGDRERCLEAGMDDYLSKPFPFDQLREKLGQWLPAGGAETDACGQIDLAALRELSGGDEEFEREIASAFLETAPGLVEELARALAAENLDQAARAAHTLTGSGRSIGALAFADLCHTICVAARAGDRDACLRLESDLEPSYLLLEAELTRFTLPRAA